MERVSFILIRLRPLRTAESTLCDHCRPVETGCLSKDSMTLRDDLAFTGLAVAPNGAARSDTRSRSMSRKARILSQFPGTLLILRYKAQCILIGL
jgi:hypothetical protein